MLLLLLLGVLCSPAAVSVQQDAASATVTRCNVTIEGHGSKVQGVKYASVHCTGPPADVNVHGSLVAAGGAAAFIGVGPNATGGGICKKWKEMNVPAGPSKPLRTLLDFCGSHKLHLRVDISNLWLDYSSADQDTAVLGLSGAVHATVQHSSMLRNKAGSLMLVTDAAVVRLEHSRIVGSQATVGAGVWAAGQSTLHMFNSSIAECISDTTSEGFGGGGISAAGNATVIITQSEFVACHAFYGGAVRAGEFSNVTIIDSQLVNNTARHAPALAVQSSAVASVMNCAIHGNRADVLGGALATSHVASLTVGGNTVIDHNYAADYGGAILLAHRSSLILEGNTVVSSCVTGYSGGAITAWHYSRVLIRGNVSFFDNTAEQGGALYARDNSSVLIQGSNLLRNTATECGGALHVRNNASVVVSSSTLTSNAGARGAAVCAAGTTRLTLAGSTLSHNVASEEGGAIAAEDTATVIIAHSMVTGNQAGRGAGVYAHGAASVALQDGAVLQGNRAQASGGGLHVTDNASVGLSIASCVVENAAAAWGGGMWISNSNFNITEVQHVVRDNQAVWDADVSSAVQQLAVIGSSTVNDFVSRLGSEEGILPVAVAVTAHAQLPCSGLMVQAVLNNEQPLGLTATDANGTAHFRLKIQQAPGIYTITFTLPAQQHIPAANVSLQVRSCQKGEVSSAPDACQLCTEGWYSLDPSHTACQACPAGAKCEGAVLLPQPGWWHSHAASVQMHRCPNPSACGGLASNHTRQEVTSQELTQAAGAAAHVITTSTGTQYAAVQCTGGYLGNLCAVCASGYSKVKLFICKKCMPAGAIIALYTIMAMVTLLLLKLLVHVALMPKQARYSRVQCKSVSPFNKLSPWHVSPPIVSAWSTGNLSTSSSTSTSSLHGGFQMLLRPLVLHVQWLGIVLSISVEWPAWFPMHAVSVAFAPVASSSADFLGLNCLLQTSSSTGLTCLPVPIQSTLLSLCLPLAQLLMLLLIEACWSCLSKAQCCNCTGRGSSSSVSTGMRLVCSMLIAALFFLPSVGRTVFSMFACVQIDAPVAAPYTAAAVGRFWLQDTMQPCFEGYHRDWALALGVPLVLLICIGLPGTVVLITLLNRKQLHHKRFRAHWGFLYSQHTPACCFWEGVLALETLTLLGISVFGFAFGAFYQAAAMTAALCIVGLLLMIFEPYSSQEAGRVARQSVGCLLITSLASLSFVPLTPGNSGTAGSSNSSNCAFGGALSLGLPPHAAHVYGVVVGVIVILVNVVFVATVVMQILYALNWRLWAMFVQRVVSCNRHAPTSASGEAKNSVTEPGGI